MGYTTDFMGEIKIKPELTVKQLVFIKSMFGDMREYNPIDAKKHELTHFDFEFNEDMNSIRWNGAEKFYDAVEKMQYVIDKTTKKFPKIKFEGILFAQGEELEDRWKLIVKDNKAKKVEITVKGKKVTCPNCEEDFILEE